MSRNENRVLLWKAMDGTQHMRGPTEPFVAITAEHIENSGDILLGVYDKAEAPTGRNYILDEVEPFLRIRLPMAHLIYGSKTRGYSCTLHERRKGRLKMTPNLLDAKLKLDLVAVEKIDGVVVSRKVGIFDIDMQKIRDLNSKAPGAEVRSHDPIQSL